MNESQLRWIIIQLQNIQDYASMTVPEQQEARAVSGCIQSAITGLTDRYGTTFDLKDIV